MDGLPLAIELAAARSKLFSPQSLLSQMQQRALPLLTGGARDLPLRQRTLYATIQWSYDLLSLEEQQLLRWLAVFVGGFTLEAAQAVIAQRQPPAEQPPLSLLAGLGSLVDKSLLQRSESGGEPRFSLLVMVREFALEQLQQCGESGLAGNAHAAYFLQWVETAATHLRGAKQNHWLARLAGDHDNLRAALRFVLTTGQHESSLRLGNALARYWLLHGHLSEGLQWLNQILDFRPFTSFEGRFWILDLSGENVEQSKINSLKSKIAGLFCAAGDLTKYRGDLRQAMTLCQESLRLFREVADQPGIAEALHTLAQSTMRAGQFEQALALHEESLALHRALGDSWGIARDLVYLGLIHWTRGDYPTARPLAEEGLARCRTAGDPQRIAQALQALGWIVLAQDELVLGERLFAESVEICRQTDDRAGMGRALPALAWITAQQGVAQQGVAQQGDYRQSHSLLSAAWSNLSELGDRYHLAACLSIFSHLALLLQQPQRAIQLLSAVEQLRSSIGSGWPIFIRTQLERNLAILRTQLDETTFAALWAAGQTLGLEQLPTFFPTLPTAPTAQPSPASASYPAGLTEREVDVLRLLAQGLTNAQIAEKLIVSPYTVNAHLRTIYGKLEVPTRAAATRLAIEYGLV